MAPSDRDRLESFGVDVGGEASAPGRLGEWMLVEGDRLSIAVGFALVVYLLLVVLHTADLVAFADGAVIAPLAGGMIAGTFSLVTLVVSINQLILSRQFVTADEARERIGGVEEFRRDVADVTRVPATPTEPTKQLELLLAAIRDRAHSLSDAVADHGDDEVRDLTTRYARSVIENTERVEESLEHTSSASLQAVTASVAYDDAWQQYVASRLRNAHAKTLSPESVRRFDDLLDALRLFNVAREQFKTTHLQRELTRFSQVTIYAGGPAAVAAVLVGLVYAETGGVAVPRPYLPYVSSALVAVVFLPVGVLLSFVLRTATVARRTASTGPTIPDKDPDEGPFDPSYGEE